MVYIVMSKQVKEKMYKLPRICYSTLCVSLVEEALSAADPFIISVLNAFGVTKSRLRRVRNCMGDVSLGFALATSIHVTIT